MKSLSPQTVHECFARQAQVSPQAVAVVCGNRELNYAQLDQSANHLANHLISLGVKKGERVAIYLERSPEMIIGLLGILKAGGAYVPLDTTYPNERLEFILRDCAARWCLAHSSTVAHLAQAGLPVHVVDLDEEAGSIAANPAICPVLEMTGDDLIYVMYTSGSTGRPKGVLICHRGVVRLVRETDYCRFGPGEVFLQLAPLAFDASTFEIWGPLLNGSRLVMMPPGTPSIADLESVLRRHNVTTLWLTAGLFHLAVEQRAEAFSGLRQLLAGGDVLSPGHVKKALDAMRDGVVINGYGPTECTTFACCFRMTKDYSPAARIPIGRPIARTTVRVLNEQMQRVEAGAPGELYLGGDGLADGYLDNEELTREKFVSDPFGANPGERLYRTGDQVRELADGSLQFLGRLDHQVKISGHRVELGEIEATLKTHPRVRQAVVVASSKGEADKQLVAFVVTEQPEDPPIDELKRHLSLSLPQYMLPSHFVRLESFPLNANGKVDRFALPKPQPTKAEAMPPDGVGTEEMIAALWSRIFGRDVGRDDNFFDLGGSSLQLIEVHAELAKIISVNLPLVELFEHATVRSLAARLANSSAAAVPPNSASSRAKLQREAFARRSRQKEVGR